MVVTTVTDRVKRPYHHGDLRRVLLDAAERLVEQVGSDRISLRELARAAGVSSKAPYNHFEDKEALLTALAIRAFLAFGEAIGKADREAEPGRELEAQIVAYVQFALAAPGRFSMMFGPRRMEPEGELARVKPRGFEVLYARCEREAVSGEDVLARATAYWSLAHGLAVLFLDGLARDRMTGTDDEIIRRVAAAHRRYGAPDKPADS